MGCNSSSSLKASRTASSASLEQGITAAKTGVSETDRAYLRKLLYLYLAKHGYVELLNGQYDVDDLVDYGILKGMKPLDEKLAAKFGESLIIFEQDFRKTGPIDTARLAKEKEDIAREKKRQSEERLRRARNGSTSRIPRRLSKLRGNTEKRTTKQGDQPRLPVYSRTLPAARSRLSGSNWDSARKSPTSSSKHLFLQTQSSNKETSLGGTSLGTHVSTPGSSTVSTASSNNKVLKSEVMLPPPPPEFAERELTPITRRMKKKATRRTTMSGALGRGNSIRSSSSQFSRPLSHALHADLEAYLLQVDPASLVDKIHVYETYALSFGIVELAEKLLDTYGEPFTQRIKSGATLDKFRKKLNASRKKQSLKEDLMPVTNERQNSNTVPIRPPSPIDDQDSVFSITTVEEEYLQANPVSGPVSTSTKVVQTRKPLNDTAGPPGVSLSELMLNMEGEATSSVPNDSVGGRLSQDLKEEDEEFWNTHQDGDINNRGVNTRNTAAEATSNGENKAYSDTSSQFTYSSYTESYASDGDSDDESFASDDTDPLVDQETFSSNIN